MWPSGAGLVQTAHAEPDPTRLHKHPWELPEYVQQMCDQLEMAHNITREALCESVTRAKRQYDKNACHTQYKVGNAVWYLIKGTSHVKNKVKKFLPSYERPYFVMGHLDDLVYRIQKGPRAKVKVVHHDQLKCYRSREPLDNTWVLDQSQNWTPSEILPPAVDGHPADREDLALHNLYSAASSDGPSDSWPSTPPATNTHMIGSLPSTPSHVSLDHGEGVVGGPHHQSPREPRPQRQRGGVGTGSLTESPMTVYICTRDFIIHVFDLWSSLFYTFFSTKNRCFMDVPVVFLSLRLLVSPGLSPSGSSPLQYMSSLFTNTGSTTSHQTLGSSCPCKPALPSHRHHRRYHHIVKDLCSALASSSIPENCNDLTMQGAASGSDVTKYFAHNTARMERQEENLAATGRAVQALVAQVSGLNQQVQQLTQPIAPNPLPISPTSVCHYEPRLPTPESYSGRAGEFVKHARRVPRPEGSVQ
ncbi:uncharacterized protein LOC132115604 [Carassius carassius]|uniref:uncharacterized protein LOC132115604 n=1 Tax=Carassius carassius TaxID=217509 RepID=UPI0028687A5B|nr:uncharacterized protein LOC132115604 [Carassius carassius]